MILGESSVMRDSTTNLRSSMGNSKAFQLSKGDKLKQQQMDKVIKSTIDRISIDEIINI